MKVSITIVFIFLMIGLVMSCEQDIAIQPNDIDIERISNSKSFKMLQSSSENFQQPYLKQLENLTDSQKEKLFEFANKSTSDLNRNEYREVVLIMGYEGIEEL